MSFRENLPLALAIVAIGLGIAQKFHPFGMRVPPLVLFAAALLLALRWVIRRQGRKREAILKKVPKRPLGIGDD